MRNRIINSRAGFAVLYALMVVLTFAQAFLNSALSDVQIMPYETAVKSGTISNRINIDYKEAIHKDRIGSTFFTYVIKKFNSRPTKTTVARGFEQRALPHLVKVGSAIANPGGVGESLEVTLGTGQADYMAVNDTLAFSFAPDYDGGYTNIAYVTDKLTNSKVVITPVDPTAKLGVDVSTGIPINTEVNITGSMFAQNSGSVEPITVRPVVVENVTQIQRTPYAMSESARFERLYGESERSRLREFAEQRHAFKRENSMLFNGKMIKIDSGSNADKVHRGYMQGVEYTFLQWGTNDEYVTWDYDRFLDWMSNIFNPLFLDGNQSKRLVLTNQAGRRKITDLAASKKWEMKEGKRSMWGTTGVKEVCTDSGDIDLFVHPIVNMKYNNINKPYFLAFHPAYVEYVPFKGRETRLKANIQNNDVDGIKDEFITEETNNIYLPELGGVFRAV